MNNLIYGPNIRNILFALHILVFSWMLTDPANISGLICKHEYVSNRLYCSNVKIFCNKIILYSSNKMLLEQCSLKVKM